jgi:hypothetical protein
MDETPPAVGPDPHEPPPALPPGAMQTNPEQTMMIIGELGKMETRQNERSDRIEQKIDDTSKIVAANEERSRNNAAEIDKGQAVQAVHEMRFASYRESAAASSGTAPGVAGWTRPVGVGVGAASGGTIVMYLLYYLGQWMGWL